MNYQRYIRSKAWQQQRQAALRRVKNKCEFCGEREGLEVHHLTYKRLGHERPDDLKVVCKGCHWIADNMRKDPSYKVPPAPPNGWVDIEPVPPKIDPRVLPVHQRKNQF